MWLHSEEAGKLKFSQGSPKDGPVVLGEFFIKNEIELLLNLRSIERAITAIEFFDKHIPRTVAIVKFATIINRLFNVLEASSKPILSSYFDRDDIVELDPKALTDKLIGIASESKDKNARAEALGEFIQDLANKPEPEAEKIPVNYYEEGIESLRFCLVVRQKSAFERWQGKGKYTALDAIKDIMNQ